MLSRDMMIPVLSKKFGGHIPMHDDVPVFKLLAFSHTIIILGQDIRCCMLYTITIPAQRAPGDVWSYQESVC